MSYPNPYEFPIPTDTSYQISFVSNADYHQRATVKQGGVTTVFDGVGEAVQMTTEDGQSSLTGATKQSAVTSVLFEFSPDGVTFAASTVAQAWQSATLVLAGTEDGTDNDNNDTVMNATLTKL